MTGTPGGVDLPRYFLAPFVPSPPEVVERMLRLAGVTESDLVYDLGCGDGRLLVAAAERYGARGVGVDLEPFRIEESQRQARAAGVEHLVTFRVGDAMRADVSEATVVLLYLVEWSTEKLGRQLARRLRPGARIVSHSFAIGDWAPSRVERWRDGQGALRTIYSWTVRATPDDRPEEPEAAPSLLPQGLVGTEVPLRLDQLTHDHFLPLLGTRFTVDLIAPPVELTLAEAAELPRRTAALTAQRAPFSLVFHGPRQPRLEQQIYPLLHAALGRLEIFLVPVDGHGPAVTYQAIFT
jgi:SAM-dependent methyltransferase